MSCMLSLAQALASLYKCTGRAICRHCCQHKQQHPHKQNVKVYSQSFYLIGKELSSKLSCTRTGLVFQALMCQGSGHLPR